LPIMTYSFLIASVLFISYNYNKIPVYRYSCKFS
jgi:hypothetical protein